MIYIIAHIDFMHPVDGPPRLTL